MSTNSESCLLPLEILSIIISLVQNKTDQDSLCLVCRAWRELVYSVFSNYKAKKNISDRDLVNVSKSLQKISTLRSFSLSFCERVTDDGIKKMSKFLTNITSLDLSFMSENITDSSLQHVSTNLKNLSHLDLSENFHMSDKGVNFLCRSESFPCSLVSISLEGCSSISGQGLKLLSESWTNLKTLNLGWCTNIEEQAFKSYLAVYLTSLTSLDLSNCSQLTDNSLISISKTCTNLISLSIQRCKLISDQSLISVCQCLSRLVSINLNTSSRENGFLRFSLFTDLGIENLLLLTKLTTLELSNTRYVSENPFSILISKLSCLSELNLKNNRQLSDKSLEPFSLGLTKDLTSLNISDNPQLSDLAIFYLCGFVGQRPDIASRTHRNRNRMMGHHARGHSRGSRNHSQGSRGSNTSSGDNSTGSTRDSYEETNSTSPSVGSLSIEENTPTLTGTSALETNTTITTTTASITGSLSPNTAINCEEDEKQKAKENELKSISQGALFLRKLILTNCRNLTDQSLAVISTSFHNLQTLEINHCILVTDEGIQSLCNSLYLQSSLTKLDISSCPLITDLTMYYISSSLYSLRILLFSSCPLVTYAGVSLLAENFQKYSSNLDLTDLYSQFEGDI